MRRPPRPQSEPLLNGELIWHIVFVSSLFLAAVFGMYSHAVSQGYSQALSSTIALNTLVVLEIFHLLFIRNIYGTSLTLRAVRGTPIVWACVSIVILAQFAITYWSPLQQIFATQAVPLFDGLLIVVIGILFFAIIESEKQLRLTFRRKTTE